MSLKTVLKYFVSWRLIVFLVAVLAMFVITPQTRFTDLTPVASTADLLKMWSNFDGIHYQDIAKYDYGTSTKTDMDYAFFPVYPWLIRNINPIIGNFTVSGLIVSNLAFIFALFMLYKLIRLDHTAKIAKYTIFLLLIFPTSFFFGSVYNESTFLLLAVLTFYFAGKNNFPLACIFAAIATATRITGIFLWPALAIEFFSVYGHSLKTFLKPKILWLALPPLGLLSYMYYQFRMTGDPFFFVNVQNMMSGRSTEKLVLLYQVFYRYIKMLITVDPWSPTYFTVILEFLVGGLFLLLLIFSIKKIRISYWVFCALSYFLPTFTGTLLSLPRFAIVLFPMFIFLATWLDRRHPYIRYVYYALCFVLSFLSIAFFTRGYFIG
jgi:Gpi18-like mannosyltransferase